MSFYNGLALVCPIHMRVAVFLIRFALYIAFLT